MAGRVCYDLGVGDKAEPGWIGVDKRSGGKIQPGVIADLEKLPLPIADNSADELRAIHIIEHFWAWDVPAILADWFRILKPGGKMAIECPDIKKVMALMNVPEIPPSLTYWALYGDPRHQEPAMMHRWCYSRQQMENLMHGAGFVEVTHQPPKFHHPARDMRVIGFKPFPESKIVLADAA